MKISLLFLSLISSTGLVSAFTVAVTNQSQFSDPSLPLTDDVGSPLASGTVAVGYFESDDVILTNRMDFTELLGRFTEFGTSKSLLGTGSAVGLIDIVGNANWDVPIPFNSNSEIIGKNIYVIFGNGDVLADSDLLAVWRSESVFGRDNVFGHGRAAVDLSVGEGSLLLGVDNGPTDIIGDPSGVIVSYTNSIGLVKAVPEPSSCLLASLAGLAFVYRRLR